MLHENKANYNHESQLMTNWDYSRMVTFGPRDTIDTLTPDELHSFRLRYDIPQELRLFFLINTNDQTNSYNGPNFINQPEVEEARQSLDAICIVVAIEYEEVGESPYSKGAKYYARYHACKKKNDKRKARASNPDKWPPSGSLKLRSQHQINGVRITQPISGSESRDAPIISIPKQQVENRIKDVEKSTLLAVKVEGLTTSITKPIEAFIVSPSTIVATSTIYIQIYASIASIPTLASESGSFSALSSQEIIVHIKGNADGGNLHEVLGLKEEKEEEEEKKIKAKAKRL
ncbi:hypothetical protein ACFE04_028553 [Oxalis oulophora]